MKTAPRFTAFSKAARYAAAAAALFGTAEAGVPELASSEAEYQLMRGSLTLGRAHFKLAPQGEPGCYQYEYDAKPKGMARLFIGEVSETSRFCLVAGQIRSSQFEFKRSDKKKDSFKLAFDWNRRVVRSDNGSERALEPGMVDRLAMQLAVQQWVRSRKGQPGPAEFTTTKVEEDRVKTYRFRIIATETLKIEAGSFETVRVERVDDPKKSVRFWLTPAQDYKAVRVEYTKDGDEEFHMELKLG